MTFTRSTHGALALALALALGAATLAGCSGCEAAPVNEPQNNTTTCVPGETGCACAPGDACVDAVCAEGLCVGVEAVGLTVDAPGARSCEVLLTETGGARVLDADFSDGVLGATRRRAPRVALAVSAAADADLPASLGVFSVDGALADVQVTSVACFSADGASIDGALAKLED